MYMVLPADQLRSLGADDHFAWRAQAAGAAAIETLLVDLDTLDLRPRSVTLEGAWVYQGWIIEAEQYEQLAATLSRRGGRPLTSPEQYSRAHHLPGWYKTFASLTPTSGWVPTGADAGTLEDAARLVGPGPT